MLLASALHAQTVDQRMLQESFELRGPNAVQVSDFEWIDTARGRRIPLRSRMPASGDSAPLILFSHGLGGSVDAGTLWADHWASHGFAVLHIEHVGSNFQTVFAPGAEGIRQRVKEAASARELTERARDVKFVLDQLESRRKAGEAFAQRLDLSRIGMVGHSFGAQTTQAIAGQNFPVASKSPLADTRPRAFIALSPSRRGNQADAFADISRPMFGLTGTNDGFVAPGLGVPPADRLKPYAMMPPGDKYLLNLNGADHMIFSGMTRRELSPNKTIVSDARLDDSQRVIIVATTTAFWRAYLTEDAQARSWLQQAARYVGAAGSFSAK